jgi:hypothetical protein
LRFLVAAYGYGTVVSLSALLLEEMSFHRYHRWRDVARGFLAALVENVGYRQLLAPYQIQGAWLAWRGREAVWGTIGRTDFDEPTAGPSAR